MLILYSDNKPTMFLRNIHTMLIRYYNHKTNRIPTTVWHETGRYNAPIYQR